MRYWEYLSIRTSRPPAATTRVGLPTVNWPIASARPVARSEGSVCGEPGTMFTLEASIPARFANSGNSLMTIDAGRSARVLPSSACGFAIPLSASVAMAACVDWLVTATILTGNPATIRPIMLPVISEPE